MFDVRQHLVGHEKDVRCIGQLTRQEDSTFLISGSCDGTLRVWKEKPDAGATSFAEVQCTKSDSDTVAAVCEMPPSERWPDGAIVAACTDRKIRYYEGRNFQLVKVLEGHDGRVCCLVVDVGSGYLASGSWDCTARVWDTNDESQQFIGHSGTVWTVAFLPLQGGAKLLTGSSDKSIILWEDGNTPLRSYHGHTDCVRGLYVLSELNFLSCANDGIIFLWNAETAERVRKYAGHSHYIYSISSQPDLAWFASGSEDHTLRIWDKHSDRCLQTLRLPCQTIWAVVVLTNGDVACACSDASIRIFTSVASRRAVPEKLTAYEQVLAAFELTVQANDKTGHLNYSDLPGMDILNRPSERDGQTILVRDSQNRVQAFSWSTSDERWNCVGPAIEKSIGLKQKTVYHGKEYDRVFTIDVADNQPHLMLPYNFDEDPWECASKFISKHNLPIGYLERVVSFIRENTPESAVQNSFVTTSIDPFTGSSRYIADSSSGANERKMDDGVDPFTGSMRYVPSDSNDFEARMLDPLKPRGYGIPLREYYFFSSVNAEGLAARLNAFNSEVAPKLSINADCLACLERFTRNSSEELTDEAMSALRNCLEWPKEHLLPVIDCLRLVLLNEKGNCFFFGNRLGLDLAQKLSSFLRTNGPEQQSEMLLIVVLRALANSFAHQPGREVMYSCDADFWSNVFEALQWKKTSIQLAASAAVANVTHLYTTQVDRVEAIDRKVRLLGALLKKLNAMLQLDSISVDTNVLFRILQVFVTLLYGDYDVVKYAKVMNMATLLGKLNSLATNDREKKMVSSIESMLTAIA
uniref:Phospholipase A-2-activating protein n=1 Tax=Trichuris muris TaxID=70415 RepID=A0A5S6QBG2_TRIMR